MSAKVKKKKGGKQKRETKETKEEDEKKEEMKKNEKIPLWIPDSNAEIKWREKVEKNKKAREMINQRILDSILRNETLSSHVRREMETDRPRLVVSNQAQWDPFLKLMGATREEEEEEEKDSKEERKSTDASGHNNKTGTTLTATTTTTTTKNNDVEWSGIPRWKAKAWQRQRNYFCISSGRATTEVGLQSGDKVLSAHSTLRASYFGITYTEWFALLLAVSPFQPSPTVLEWIVTQRIPTEWCDWYRAVEDDSETSSRVFCFDAERTGLNGQWATECIHMIQTHLLTASGWELGKNYTRYLDERLGYNKIEIPELYFTIAKPPKNNDTDKDDTSKSLSSSSSSSSPDQRLLTKSKSSSSSSVRKTLTKETKTRKSNSKSKSKSKEEDEKKKEEETEKVLCTRMVPCVCRYGDIVIVGQKTGTAYVIDDRGVCVSFIDNDRESETIGTQLPPSFQVPRPFPVFYWLKPPSSSSSSSSSSASASASRGLAGWLEMFQPPQFICNFDANPTHYDTGDIVFRTMVRTQSGPNPWIKDDEKDWWLVYAMESEIEADGKSADNSKIRWASLEFPLGMDPCTGEPNVVTVYVWQRGPKRVTQDECWKAIQDRYNLFEAMPSGGQRLRVPTEQEVVRLHEGDGA